MSTRYQAAMYDEDETLQDYTDGFDTKAEAVSAAKASLTHNSSYTYAEIEETKTISRVSAKRSFREEKVK